MHGPNRYTLMSSAAQILPTALHRTERGDKEEKSDTQVCDCLCTTGTRFPAIRLIDGVSAVLSMLALAIALWRLSENGLAAYARPLAAQNTLIAPEDSPLSARLADVIGLTLNTTCTAAGNSPSFKMIPSRIARWMFAGWLLPLEDSPPYTLSIAHATYDDELYTGTTLDMAAGEFNTDRKSVV